MIDLCEYCRYSVKPETIHYSQSCTVSVIIEVPGLNRTVRRWWWQWRHHRASCCCSWTSSTTSECSHGERRSLRTSETSAVLYRTCWRRWKHRNRASSALSVRLMATSRVYRSVTDCLFRFRRPASSRSIGIFCYFARPTLIDWTNCNGWLLFNHMYQRSSVEGFLYFLMYTLYLLVLLFHGK